MLQWLLSILGILLTVFFVIGTHEAAHFITARLFGIKVLRFSIGFGKALWRWHDKRGTEYVIALVPLGGYVKMLDENEGPVSKEEQHLAFNHQPFYKKFLVVLAGPAINILCALILYWLVFMIGFITVKPIIGHVTPHSIAAESGLKPEQEIVRVDHQTTFTWTNILFHLLAHAGNRDYLTIEVKDPKSNRIETHTLSLSQWHMDELTPDPLGSLGIIPYEPNIPLVIGLIHPQSPAASSTLQMGDKIIALDKKPIKNWNELTLTVMNQPNQIISFTIERKGKIIHIPVQIGYQRNMLLQKVGYLGIGPFFIWPSTLLHKIQYGPFIAIAHAYQEVMNLAYFNLLIFGKMITGKLSLESLGGPITIFETAGSALNYGFLSFMSFLAFLSISIGIINLLPIPGLDGGHLVFQIVEWIIRRPLPQKILVFFYYLGFILIIFVLTHALINDLLRLSL